MNGYLQSSCTFSSYVGDQALAQAVQSCGCSMPGSVQGKVGWVLEKPGPVEDTLTLEEGLELGHL